MITAIIIILVLSVLAVLAFTIYAVGNLIYATIKFRSLKIELEKKIYEMGKSDQFGRAK